MTTFGAVLDSVSQALFFEVMTEKADQRCSTFLLPQCGHRASPSSWSTRDRILTMNFLQARQKNSWWGIQTSTVLKGDGRILDPLGRQVHHGARLRILRALGLGLFRRVRTRILRGSAGWNWRRLRTKEFQGTLRCSAKGGLLPCQGHRIVRCR
jgi:hypothetical protein